MSYASSGYTRRSSPGKTLPASVTTPLLGQQELSLGLADLPMAWLHHLAVTLTAESAARLRSSCVLLQQVIDATWEPYDEPVPPHRRSVPLTFEQVRAQLPQLIPRVEQGAESVDGSESEDEDAVWQDRYERPHQDGCNPYWLEVWGPALTRLTANQAVNMLKGKPLLGFLSGAESRLSKHSTVAERMEEHKWHGVVELALDDFPVPWPPTRNTSRNTNMGAFKLQGELSGSELSEQEDSASEDYDIWGGRGAGGWDTEKGFYAGTCTLPAQVFDSLPDYEQGFYSGGYRVWVSSDCLVSANNSLLATTDSSCREATPTEVKQFLASDDPADGNKYDVYLSIWHGQLSSDLYVFLEPFQPRFTGRPKVTAQHVPTA